MPIPTDYRLVMDRLREALPNITSISTHDPVMLTPSAGYIQVTIRWKNGMRTTGSSLFRLDVEGRSAKATSPIEDCETSAVGRALGFAGYYGPESFASTEEIAKAEQYAEYDSITATDEATVEDGIQFLRDNKEAVQVLYPDMTPRLFRNLNSTEQFSVIAAVKRGHRNPREPETEDDSSSLSDIRGPGPAFGPMIDTLTTLLHEREVVHDGRRLSDLTATEADELFPSWQAARKRRMEATCKYCTRTIYWCKLPGSTQSMPMNSDGTLHNTTCAGKDSPTLAKPPLYTNPAFDTLEPNEPSNVLAPAIFKNQDTDNFSITSLAKLMEHALSDTTETPAADADVHLLDGLFAHLYPDATPATLAWWIDYLLSARTTQHRVDALLWWLSTRPAHDARRAMDILVWDTAATYGPLKTLPAASKPSLWPKRALILWAKTLLADEDAATALGAKNRADIFLALDTAWQQRNGAQYYMLDNADRETIYRGLASDRRVTEYVLSAKETDDGPTKSD